MHRTSELIGGETRLPVSGLPTAIPYIAFDESEAERFRELGTTIT